MRLTAFAAIALSLVAACQAVPLRAVSPSVEGAPASATGLATVTIRVVLPREAQALVSNTQSVTVRLRNGVVVRNATLGAGGGQITFADLPAGGGYTLYAAGFAGAAGTGRMMSWGRLPVTLASGRNQLGLSLSVVLASGAGADDLEGGPAGAGAEQLGAQRVLTSMDDFAPGTASSVEVYSTGQHDYLGQFGSAGSGNGQFGNLINEIAIDRRGDIWVCDKPQNRVLKFDAGGTFLRGIGQGQIWVAPTAAPASTASSTANQGFNQPTSLACDAENNLYVTDYTNYRVLKFDANGTFLMGVGYGTSWVAPSTASVVAPTNASGSHTPHGVAIDRNGNLVVTDVNSHRLQIFNQNGVCIRGIGQGTTWTGAPQPAATGSVSRAFESPWIVKVGPDGFYYVTDNTNRVQVITSSGAFVRSFSTATADKPTNSSGHLGISPTGLLYVTAYGAAPYFTQVFTPTGVPLSRYGRSGTGNCEFSNPGGMEWAADGSLWHVDRLGFRVQHLRGQDPKGTGGALRLTGDRQPDAPVYAASGTYETPPLDAGAAVTWRSVFWNVESLPALTGVAVDVATASDGLDWGGWQLVTGTSMPGGNAFNLPGVSGRYLKTRLSLSSANPAVSPVVQEVGATY
ncbi:MAG TPA: NHL repeat-containing protein [Pantanalinema sp.]